VTAPFRVGDTVEPLVRVPTTVAMFRFAAATWNTHRIHFDHHYATQVEDHPDLVVQMTLLGSYLGQLAHRTAGRGGRVRRLSYRAVASARPDLEVTCTGRVAKVTRVPGAAQLTVTLTASQNGQGCLIGEAQLELADFAS
jgi:acyl dehydratase